MEFPSMFGRPVIDAPELVKQFGGYRYYKCPWSSEPDHYATMNMEGNIILRPLHCYICNEMGWVNVFAGVAEVLRSEEARFRKALARFDGVISLSPEDACEAWHSQGLPYELAEEIATNAAELRKLCEEHRKKGGKGKKFQTIYEQGQ